MKQDAPIPAGTSCDIRAPALCDVERAIGTSRGKVLSRVFEARYLYCHTSSCSFPSSLGSHFGYSVAIWFCFRRVYLQLMLFGPARHGKRSRGSVGIRCRGAPGPPSVVA